MTITYSTRVKGIDGTGFKVSSGTIRFLLHGRDFSLSCLRRVSMQLPYAMSVLKSYCVSMLNPIQIRLVRQLLKRVITEHKQMVYITLFTDIRAWDGYIRTGCLILKHFPTDHLTVIYNHSQHFNIIL